MRTNYEDSFQTRVMGGAAANRGAEKKRPPRRRFRGGQDARLLTALNHYDEGIPALAEKDNQAMANLSRIGGSRKIRAPENSPPSVNRLCAHAGLDKTARGLFRRLHANAWSLQAALDAGSPIPTQNLRSLAADLRVDAMAAKAIADAQRSAAP